MYDPCDASSYFMSFDICPGRVVTCRFKRGTRAVSVRRALYLMLSPGVPTRFTGELWPPGQRVRTHE